MHMQGSEPAAQFDLLAKRHFLVAKHQHPAFGQQLFDGINSGIIQFAQRYAAQFGADVVIQIVSKRT